MALVRGERCIDNVGRGTGSVNSYLCYVSSTPRLDGEKFLSCQNSWVILLSTYYPRGWHR